MSKQLATLTVLAAALGLTACGGNAGAGAGDGGNASAVQGGTGPVAGKAMAEGVWHSEQSNSDVLDLVLLEDGRLYALTSSSKTGGLRLGLSQGNYTLSGDVLAAPLAYYSDLVAELTGGVSARVITGTSIAGNATTDGSATVNAFSVKPLAAADNTYRYDTSASLDSITDTWLTATLLEHSTPVGFKIDTNGVLTSTNLGCSFTGKLEPRATGKNVFDITLVFGPTACAGAGKTVSGIAISYIASNGKRQFSAALQDPGKTFGTMLYAQR